MTNLNRPSDLFDLEGRSREKRVAAAYLDRLPPELVKAAVQAIRDKFGITFSPARIQDINKEQLTFFARQLFPGKPIDTASYTIDRGTDGADYSFIRAFENIER